MNPALRRSVSRPRPVRVCEPMIVRALFRRPDGIDAARQSEGEKVEKDLLILLKAPCPQGVRRAGILSPQFSRADSTASKAFVPSTPRSELAREDLKTGITG
jgi:hypothetical protein